MKFGLEEELIMWIMKTSITQIWMVCHLLPFAKVGQSCSGKGACMHMAGLHRASFQHLKACNLTNTFDKHLITGFFSGGGGGGIKARVYGRGVSASQGMENLLNLCINIAFYLQIIRNRFMCSGSDQCPAFFFFLFFNSLINNREPQGYGPLCPLSYASAQFDWQLVDS